ncbi:sensor domain-containing diguanylate cyclase [Sphingomonas arenae]|uniref:sensor domain-containing diguanylate cyclase n=1 Tax=Sphingomonas arenae TaxID=2812555 RepID=UPI001966DA4E|nr:sensor domain-containing diguanylate cyclase [Sphingomonas arenae]
MNPQLNDAHRHKLGDEAGRLLALRRYGVLDTAREKHFDVVTSLVRDVLGVPVCAISLIDETRQWFKSISGLKAEGTACEFAFCDHTIRSPGCFVVEDAETDPRFAASPLVRGNPRIRSYAGAPLTTPDGYNVGSLCVIDGQPRSFSARDLQRLTGFAELVVEQLELRTLACEDGLTGALSRRAFLDAARGAIRHFGRDSRPLSLISLDVDHFKQVNDRFGHPAGDRVLKAVVEACQPELRPRDLLGRMGGEEFAVLVSDATADMALHCAERLRRSVATLDLGKTGRITASFGVAQLRPGVDMDAWLEEADAALYAAKKAGRNRCEVAVSRLQVAA